MKVLFVHHRLGAFGGAEANILLTASELGKRGHSTALLSMTRTGKNERHWQDTFDSCECFPVSHRPYWLNQQISRFEPDVIYLHNITDLEVVEALLDSGIPVVRMVHDHDLYCMRSYKYNVLTRKPCTRALSPFCVFPCLGSVTRNRSGRFPLAFSSYSEKKRELELNRRCQRLVVYSEFSRCELIRNGFETDRIATHVPISSDSASDPISSFSPRNLVLFAGQIIRGKGVDVLLRSLARVRAPFECVILGEGHHRTLCEHLSQRLGLGRKVHFKGFVPPEEMRAHYLEASVFAVSSVWPEPFGMVGPEAMRYGLPVVAFDVGGIREWLLHGENGFLAPWMDTRAFAAHIDHLLIDKELARRMGANGRQWVGTRFGVDRHITHLEQVFSEVIAPRDSIRRFSHLETQTTS